MKMMRVYPKLELSPDKPNIAVVNPVDIPEWVHNAIAIEAQKSLIKRLHTGYQGAYPALDRTLSAMMRELYNERVIK